MTAYHVCYLKGQEMKEIIKKHDLSAAVVVAVPVHCQQGAEFFPYSVYLFTFLIYMLL